MPQFSGSTGGPLLNPERFGRTCTSEIQAPYSQVPDFQQLHEEELFWAIFSKNEHSDMGARKEATVGLADQVPYSGNKIS